MKKVLILSYFFPPRPGMGSMRFYGISKYLPRFGWEPIIITAKLPSHHSHDVKVIETKYFDINKLFKSICGFDHKMGIFDQLHGTQYKKKGNWFIIINKLIKLSQDILNFPDEHIGWYTYALKAASDLILSDNINAIISTSYPVTAHLVANKLKSKYKIPWIADYRDLWSQNIYKNKLFLLKYIETILEYNTIQKADYLVTVDSDVDRLKSLHKDKNIYHITNGYDPDELSISPFFESNKFTITYTGGTLYYGKRDPSMLFQAINEMINDDIIDRLNIELLFYCPKEIWLINKIKEYNLNDIVTLKGYIPRSDVLREQRRAHLLLLMQWNHPSERSAYSGKLFEYLAARRPIIAFGPGGIVNKLIYDTEAGHYVNNLIELKKYISAYYKEYLQTGEVKYKGNQNIYKYNYHSIAKLYASILDNLITATG